MFGLFLHVFIYLVSLTVCIIRRLCQVFGLCIFLFEGLCMLKSENKMTERKEEP